ncbi:MAG: peptidase M50 [Rubripirellula sp.]|nr:peptidase M50 [Rubripirellula sp.]
MNKLPNQDEHGGDTTPTRITIDPQVVFTQREIGGQVSAVAHHAAIDKFFQLGQEEYHVAQMLDGKRTLSEITQILQAEGSDWTPQETAKFIAKLVAVRLAHPVESYDEAKSTSASNEAQNPASQNPKVRIAKGLSLLISQRIPLFPGDPVAAYLSRKIGRLFSTPGTCWSVLFIASGLILMAANATEFAAEIRRMFDASIWIALIGMWVMTKAIHEFGHATAARYHGVRVGNMGVMFFLFAPLAFVDVTGAWKLRNRFSRIQIALAGVYFELIIAAASAWAWWLLPDGLLRHLAAQLFVVAGPATMLVNANPLLRLDGYYVLSDLIEVPNLRMHGRRQLAGWLDQVLFKIQPQRPFLHGWRKKLATVHAACSVVFQAIWMGGLILGVSFWAHGLGIFIAAAAILLWVLLPLTRWVHRIWTMDGDEPWTLNFRRLRLLSYSTLLAVCCTFFFVGSSPFARRVPVIVQFHEEQIARASADAFVHAVLVIPGQRVTEGDLLLEMQDQELILKRDEKASELKVAELRAIQFRRQGELSLSATETENAKGLQRQVSELDEQLAGLQVISERDGVVRGIDLESLTGQFVKRGQELLRVSDPLEKELLVSVAESDIQAYQTANTSGLPAEVRLRGGTRFTTVPATLRPRARRSLPHPALAATAGGPLAVEQTSDERAETVQVIEARMQSFTPLDPVTSTQIHCGQIGVMTIQDNRSLLTRLVAWCKNE